MRENAMITVAASAANPIGFAFARRTVVAAAASVLWVEGKLAVVGGLIAKTTFVLTTKGLGRFTRCFRSTSPVKNPTSNADKSMIPAARVLRKNSKTTPSKIQIIPEVVKKPIAAATESRKSQRIDC